MSEVLDELIELAERGARRNFKNDPRTQLLLTFIGRTRYGRDVIIGVEHKTTFEKIVSYAHVKKVFREHQVVAYVQVAESWLAEVEGGQIPDLPPSQHPKRQEIVSIAATDGINSKAKLLIIVRARDGRVVELVAKPEVAGTMLSGQALDLLSNNA